VASQPLKAETVDLQAFGISPAWKGYAISKMTYLDIKMRYEVETDGDFKEFIKKHTDIKVSLNQPLPEYVSTNS